LHRSALIAGAIGSARRDRDEAGSFERRCANLARHGSAFDLPTQVALCLLWIKRKHHAPSQAVFETQKMIEENRRRTRKTRAQNAVLAHGPNSDLVPGVIDYAMNL
jgi:hypothetical protein